MRTVEDRAGDGYRGERGREYHERVHGQQLHSESVYRARAELARHRYFRHLPASARVFELGLGTGSNLAAIEAAEVAGFDLSETAREVSREHGIHVFDSLDEAPEGHYDVVLLRHVLEHLPDPARSIELAAAKLAPSGELLIVLPVEHGPRHQKWIRREDVHRHLYVWKLSHIVNLLRVCGFQVFEFGYEWYSMQRLLAWISRWFGIGPYHLAVTVAGHARRQSELVVRARRSVSGG